MVFEHKTQGINLALWAGTDQDFSAGKPGFSYPAQVALTLHF